MTWFRRIALLYLLSLTTACATLDLNASAYKGPDSGFLIASLGASPPTQYASYALKFRKKNKTAAGEIRYVQENVVGASHRDFDDREENGFVEVLALPLGEYEIYNFEVMQDDKLGRKSFKSATDFSLPFRIADGVATYLGDFTARAILGRDVFGEAMPAGAYFFLADKQDRDVPIAKKRMPGIGTVDIAVPPVSEKETVFIQAKKP